MGPYASIDGYHTPGGMPAFDALRLPDGRLAAVGVEHEQGFVSVWHEETPEHITSLKTTAGLHVIELSPDGKWLAMGGNDQMVTILETSNLSMKTSLDVNDCVPNVDSFGHFAASVDYYEGSGPSAVFSLEWSHDGASVYIGTQSGAVLEWSPF
jgi:WD40 repeat protein